MKTVLSFLIPFLLCASIVTGVAVADEPADYVVTAAESAGVDELAAHPYRDTLLAQADTAPAGSGSAAPVADAAPPAAAPSTPAPATAPAPQASDVGVMTKLYKNGAFFALGVMGVFIGLSIWSKLDKKRAFYIATALGGVGLLVESIRRGDTPNATSIMTMLMTTAGIMIAGPGHVKATPS